MNIKIDRGLLLKPLGNVSGIVEKRHALPILSNLLLESHQGELKFTATDLEMQISTHIKTELLDDFQITVSAKKLFDITRALPENCKIDFQIEFDHPIISKSSQRISVDITAESFLKEVSRARTFGFMSELETLKENNLALGASQKNAIAIGDDKILNADGLRLENEMIKHKILDSVGDLYLLGHNLVGSFEGYKSGHTVNNGLLRELIARPETWEVVTYDNSDTSPINYLDPIIDPSSG